MNLEATIDLESAGARRWDAVVAGAGPAGAMAALELARLGVDVLLADKAVFPRWKPCGCCLNAWGQDSLARAGLADLAARLGAVPLTRLALAAGGRRAELPVPHSVALSREALDAALARAAIAAGAHFMPGTAVRLGAAEPAEMGARRVILRQGAREVEARAGVVLAADGLAGRLVAEEPGGAVEFAEASRLGAGVTFESHGLQAGSLRDAAEAYAPGTIYMGCGAEGYVGLVRVEDGRLNAGAALDPAAVKRRGGLGPAAAAVLAESGLPGIDGFEKLPWKGTPLLTRRLATPSGERWLALGDAAGYVEPFTGEGMAWALAQGRAVAPLAAAAARAWSPECGREWGEVYSRLMTKRQRRCRAVAGALRHPRAVVMVLSGLAFIPWIGSGIVNRFTMERTKGT